MDNSFFIGRHYLSGVEYTTTEDEDGSQYEAIKFCLDDNTYIVSKDPSDGWRSYCREIIQTNVPCRNTFFPEEVCGVYEDNTDIIRFINVDNGKMVFRFGTEEVDIYYPCCVMEWLPQNLSANEPRKNNIIAKQELRKVDGMRYAYGHVDIIGECPKCGFTLYKRLNVHYCGKCGEGIKWDD